MRFPEWTAELKKLFPIADEFHLANAVYYFEDDFAEGLTPQQSYERFDQSVGASA